MTINGTLLKAFFAAVDVLEIGERDLATLLATSNASVRRYRAEPSAADLGCDQVERIMLVMAIYETLRASFGGRELGIAWLRRPNRDFGEERPIDKIIAGGIADMLNVQRYLAEY